MKKIKLKPLLFRKTKITNLTTLDFVKGGLNTLIVNCSPATEYCYYLTQVIITGVAQGPCYTGNYESACP